MYANAVYTSLTNFLKYFNQLKILLSFISNVSVLCEIGLDTHKNNDNERNGKTKIRYI